MSESKDANIERASWDFALNEFAGALAQPGWLDQLVANCERAADELVVGQLCGAVARHLDDAGFRRELWQLVRKFEARP
jgi:hypothetical protein